MFCAKHQTKSIKRAQGFLLCAYTFRIRVFSRTFNCKMLENLPSFMKATLYHFWQSSEKTHTKFSRREQHFLSFCAPPIENVRKAEISPSVTIDGMCKKKKGRKIITKRKKIKRRETIELDDILNLKGGGRSSKRGRKLQLGKYPIG